MKTDTAVRWFFRLWNWASRMHPEDARPIPVEGKTETIDVDTVILAIGQRVNAEGIDGVELTRKGGLVYDKDTYMTAIPGVFAGGDCGNDKISIAVESIGDAKKSYLIVDAYLRGEEIKYDAQLLCDQEGRYSGYFRGP